MSSPFTRQRQEQPERPRRQRLESIALIEQLAAGDLFGVAVVEHVQDHHGDPDRVGRLGDAGERVDEQVAAVAVALVTRVHPDHRDVGGRDAPVAGACARISRRQLRIVDRMGVEGVEADQRP
jgi:hypothetical protein